MDINLITDAEFTPVIRICHDGSTEEYLDRVVVLAKRNIDASCHRSRRPRNAQDDQNLQQEPATETIDVVMSISSKKHCSEGKLALVMTGDYVTYMMDKYINLIRAAVDIKCMIASSFPCPGPSTSDAAGKILGLNGSYACNRVGEKLLINVHSINKETWTLLQKKDALLAKIKISVHVADIVTNLVTNVHMMNQRFLDEEIGSDLTLVSSDGVRIKCHKVFLMGHSKVFLEMFNGGAQVETPSQITLKDMTGRGAKALLAWIYYRCIDLPCEDCAIAIELLKAGDEYDIPQLVIAMYKVLTGTSTVEGWFSIDGAVKLFQVAHQMKYSELKTKAIQVLHSKAEELDSSPSYHNVFENDPKAAMELCKAAFLYGVKTEANSETKRKPENAIVQVKRIKK